jgi:hypothetical protein
VANLVQSPVTDGAKEVSPKRALEEETLTPAPELYHNVLSHVFGRRAVAQHGIRHCHQSWIVRPEHGVECLLVPRAKTIEEVSVVHVAKLAEGLRGSNDSARLQEF